MLSQFLPEDGKTEAKLKREDRVKGRSRPLYYCYFLDSSHQPAPSSSSSYQGLKGRSIVSCPRTAVTTWRKQAKVRQQSQANECFRREKVYSSLILSLHCTVQDTVKICD